jgi:hypothetical protein
MKNNLLYKYVIDKRLPLLLGIKEEEITDIGYSKSIEFKRNNIIYQIEINEKDSGLNIKLIKSSKNDDICLLRYNTLVLLEIEGIKNDDGFEKFRNLLTESTKPPIKINCDEET